MLEMVEDGFINEWSQIYLNHTTGIAVVPFSFGSFPVQYGINKNLTGLILYEDIQKYLFDNDNFWPCWEMNDHDIVRGEIKQGSIKAMPSGNWNPPFEDSCFYKGCFKSPVFHFHILNFTS